MTLVLTLVAVVLALVAIVLALVSLCIQLRLYRAQKEQGERVAVSVMSTVDQVYRRIRHGDDPKPGFGQRDFLDGHVSPKFIRANQATRLSLDGYSTRAAHQDLMMVCVIEQPSGGSISIWKHLEVDDHRFHLEIDYPSDDFQGLTLEPGRYHVAWDVVDRFVHVSEGAGERKERIEWETSAEVAFYVVP